MIQGTRIAIIGNAGGGKTTLAKLLGEALDIPITHVDSIQYQSGWLRTPTAECNRALIDVANGDRWIIDGFGSDELIETRIQIADTLLLVDFPVWKHYWWAIKRQLAAHKGQRRELPANCPEFSFSYTWNLMRIMWLVHRQYTPWFRELVRLKQQSGGNAIVLRQPAELQALITELQIHEEKESESDQNLFL